MIYNKPDWYMTPREFADIVVESMEVTNHFKSDETAHPEDLVIAFVTLAEAVALGAGAAGRKVHRATKKEAVMNAADLRKNALPIDDEIAPATADSGLGYNEWRSNKG